MIQADCPACGAKMNLGLSPKIGQRYKCFTCRSEFEVAWLDPVELDWPYDEDDWEDLDEEGEEG